ncbi:MAG: phage portal protein [Pyrinomonadaceae bacterium]
MGTLAGEVHKEALKNGDAYVIVWPNEKGEAVFYPNKATNMTIATDEAAPGRITWAAKVWRTADKRVRLNLFYPDRIEKYISKADAEGSLPEAKEFVPFALSPRFSGQEPPEGGTQNNPFGVVPVFHFANNADLGTQGRSELEAAMPVQDGLNKSVLDMLVAMEFAAYRQRWAAGIEIEYDNDGKLVAPFTAGIDHLWISENPEARFGDFEASELDQFLKVKDSFRIDMASVTGTPLHYFLQNTAGFPSGESLKKAETRFLAKVRDRQESFGQVWADALAFALMIEGQGRAVRLITEWEDPAPMAEREFLENILLKKQIGLPVEQALLEAGYGEADVKAMIKSSGVE